MNLKDKNLYYVGGVVRDEMLGVESVDTDLCYQGDAIKFALDNFGENVIKTNPDFGTVRVLYEGKEIDIASTREETYPQKGHLPKVVNIGCSLDKDLKRRDFTINAMAKNTLTGELYDPFNGKADLADKKLRILHDQSFVDDPTRIIRGLKFSVRFGFGLETHTKELQDEYLNNINYDMSYHRVKKELVETFNLNKGDAFDAFIAQKIYKLLGENQIIPKIKGYVIEEEINKSKIFTSALWVIYLGFFDLSKLPLTRAEKKITEWSERLKTQAKTNNTPNESIILHALEGKIC